MKTCPKCGSMNTDDARFCESCGGALEDKVPQVDAEVVSEGAAFSGGNASDNGAANNGTAQNDTQNNNFSQNTTYGQNTGYTQQGYAQQGYTQQSYVQPNYSGPDYSQSGYSQPAKSDLTTVCTLSLIFGIVGFFCDPLYIITTAAFILGIVGLVNNGSKKNLALAGLICSVVAVGFQVFIDILTLGIGVFF